MTSEHHRQALRNRCLVVEPDATKRAFLAEAWAYFQPGFDVVTATDVEGALTWAAAIEPRVVSLSASLPEESRQTIIDAVSQVHGPAPWCLIAERPPGSEALAGSRTAQVIDLWDALSLEHVLRAGRTTCDVLRDLDLTPSPGVLQMNGSPVSGRSGR